MCNKDCEFPEREDYWVEYWQAYCEALEQNRISVEYVKVPDAFIKAFGNEEEK